MSDLVVYGVTMTPHEQVPGRFRLEWREQEAGSNWIERSTTVEQLDADLIKKDIGHAYRIIRYAVPRP